METANMEVDDRELADIELTTSKESPQLASSLNQLIARQYKFLESAREHKTIQFLSAMSQLAHMDHTLAEDVWLNFFPSVWKVLNEKQRESLSNELVPFICSGAHIIQRDCHPSALNTFVEAVSRCQPAIEIKPALLKYLGNFLCFLENPISIHVCLKIRRKGGTAYCPDFQIVPISGLVPIIRITTQKSCPHFTRLYACPGLLKKWGQVF